MVVIVFSGKIGSGKDTACEILQKRYPSKNFKRMALADVLKKLVAVFTNTTFEQQTKREFKDKDIWDLIDEDNIQDKLMKSTEIMSNINGLCLDYLEWTDEYWNPGGTLYDIYKNLWEYYTKYLLKRNLPEKYGTCGGIQQHMAHWLKKKYGQDCFARYLIETIKEIEIENIIVTDLRFIAEKNLFKNIFKDKVVFVRLEGDPCNLLNRTKRDINHISETELSQNNIDWDRVIRNNVPNINLFEKNLLEGLSKYIQ